MDKTLFDKGLEKRKATLGAEYVEKNLAAADDFHPPVSGGDDGLVLGLRLGRRDH
jgi:hypothetical protein